MRDIRLIRTFGRFIAICVLWTVSPALGSDAARSDADIVLGLLKETSGLVTVKDFNEKFGRGFELRNWGADEYRNFVWHFPLESSAAVLEMHIGFDYGRFFDWSMVMDFKGRTEDAHRYFVELCRAFERTTGHTSRAIHLMPPVERQTVSAFYPTETVEMIEITAVRGKVEDKVTISPSNKVAAAYFAVEIVGADRMSAWASSDAPDVKSLDKGQTLLCIDTKTVETVNGKKRYQTEWLRLQDLDDAIGWVRSGDAQAIGITTIDAAFGGPKSGDKK